MWIRVTEMCIRDRKLSVYLINSALAACAGFIYAARLSAANPSQGNGLELNGICAAVLGLSLIHISLPT